ncbi:MAG TPA: mechanosensitive ion channel domain-containing protein, partial [Gemmatimonadaceae bacterium]|nr:mechanosensitive ion channel domain-containing protein [Gemmatimonadaceae bacterium]
MITIPVFCLRAAIIAAVALLLQPAGALAQQAATTPTASAQPAAPDPEADRDAAAPVLLSGEPVIWITTGAGPYTTQYRANRISQRLESIVRERSIQNPAVSVSESEGSSELRVGSHLVMVVTPQDAKSLGAARATIAAQYANELEAAIRAERIRYAPGTLARSGIYGAVATTLLAAAVWLIFLITRWIRRQIDERWVRTHASLRVQQAEILSADRIGRTVGLIVRAVRFFLVLLLLDLHLTYVLGLFPWTRAVSHTLVGYVIAPVRVAVAAFAGYLPKLLFVLVIGAIIHLAIRLVGLVFEQIKQSRIVFENFPAEWADPTNKIVRILLIAFGLVIAFPYLPASDSPAFAGVSVFMGVLFSLASSSALSNMIAGIVLTYTGAFRLGDRVKVGDSFGDIIETTLLATR